MPTLSKIGWTLACVTVLIYYVISFAGMQSDLSSLNSDIQKHSMEYYSKEQDFSAQTTTLRKIEESLLVDLDSLEQQKQQAIKEQELKRQQEEEARLLQAQESKARAEAEAKRQAELKKLLEEQQKAQEERRLALEKQIAEERRIAEEQMLANRRRSRAS